LDASWRITLSFTLLLGRRPRVMRATVFQNTFFFFSFWCSWRRRKIVSIELTRLTLPAPRFLILFSFFENTGVVKELHTQLPLNLSFAGLRSALLFPPPDVIRLSISLRGGSRGRNVASSSAFSPSCEVAIISRFGLLGIITFFRRCCEPPSFFFFFLEKPIYCRSEGVNSADCFFFFSHPPPLSAEFNAARPKIDGFQTFSMSLNGAVHSSFLFFFSPFPSNREIIGESPPFSALLFFFSHTIRPLAKPTAGIDQRLIAMFSFPLRINLFDFSSFTIELRQEVNFSSSSPSSPQRWSFSTVHRRNEKLRSRPFFYFIEFCRLSFPLFLSLQGTLVQRFGENFPAFPLFPQRRETTGAPFNAGDSVFFSFSVNQRFQKGFHD